MKRKIDVNAIKKCNNAKLILKRIQEGLKEIVNDKLYKGEKVRIVEDSS
jgi:hypothetical protein